MYGEADHGPGSAGSISVRATPRFQRIGSDHVEQWYDLVVNRNLDVNAKLATVLHELGHLFGGHLGSPHGPRDGKRPAIPDRSGLSTEAMEFEAESVAWLICGRVGIDSASGRYLGAYLKERGAVPDVSTETIFKAVRKTEALLGGEAGLGRILRADVPTLFRQ